MELITESELESKLRLTPIGEIIGTIREDFPLLYGRVYLDNAATTQVPLSVIRRMFEFRTNNIRGNNHSPNNADARKMQELVEVTREKLGYFFSASDYIIGFTGGTTDSSNWLATRFPFERGDTLIVTDMEHNSQILTARAYAEKQGANVCYVGILKDGRLDLGHLKEIIANIKKGKILLNLIHASNVTGVINPVSQIRDILGDRGYIYLDMAQSAGHMPIDLDDLDVDFASFSAHKIYGPTGLGAIFINKKSERAVGNKISGGGAVKIVSRWLSVDADAPERFEPGTQHLDGIVELGYVIDYLDCLGMKNIEEYGKLLAEYFTTKLNEIKGIRIYGPADFKDRTAIVTFNIGSMIRRNYDAVALELDKRGISVRDGCFCAHMYLIQLLGLTHGTQNLRAGLMKAGVSDEIYKLPGAVRASFAFYNNLNDAYKAIVAIKEISERFR